MKLNLGCGKKVREGFVNVDKFEMPGVDKVMDLFRFPWSFADNTFDYVYASHLIEHIPHETKMSWEVAEKCASHPMWSQWKILQDLDGFFAFFAEVWRISKNDALVECVCPFGYTHQSFQDPTHTRVIVPQTIAYLAGEANDNGNFDYHLPFAFKGEDFSLSFNEEWRELQETQTDVFNQLLSHSWDIANEMRFTLRVIK